LVELLKPYNDELRLVLEEDATVLALVNGLLILFLTIVGEVAGEPIFFVESLIVLFFKEFERVAVVEADSEEVEFVFTGLTNIYYK